MPVRTFNLDLTDGTYWAVQWDKRKPHLAIPLQPAQVTGTPDALDWSTAERCTGRNAADLRQVSPAFVRMIEHRKLHAPKAGALPPPALHKPLPDETAPDADPDPE
jgi:hypothetical protein